MRLFLVSLSLFALATELPAQELRTVPVRRVGVIADNVGAANLATADLDGDGLNDVVSCSQGAPFAVSRSGTAYATSWMGPASRCRTVTTGDHDRDGGIEVIVGTSDTPGKLLIFDSRNLSPSRFSVTLPGTAAVADVAFGEVDGDAGGEIVAVTSANTYVYDAATLTLEWTATGYSGTRVRLGDIEGDGRNEIVISGSTGWVLDGWARTSKFGYLGGFGTNVVVGDVDADGKAEIIFAGAWSPNVTILHGDTMQTSSVRVQESQSVAGIALGDANGDGAVEIVTGNDQWGSIEGHRPSDGLLLWRISNPEHGVQAVAVSDVSGDGVSDVIWGAGYSSSGKDALFVGDAVAKVIRWTSADLDATFVSTAGDLDGDGVAEYIVASGSSNSGYSGSVLEVFDVDTGASKGVISLAPDSDLEITRLAIGQADSDPAKEIIVLGVDWYDPMLVVFDGITRLREFTSAVPPCCSSTPEFVTSTLVIANIDADAVEEIIVGMTDSRVVVLNGASNIIQGSVPVSGSVSALALAQLNNDAVPELIVGTSTGVYVYQTSDWSLQGQFASSNIFGLAASADGGGTVAVILSDLSLRTFGGPTLVPRWTCSKTALGTDGASAVALAMIGGALRLLATDNSGNVRMLDPAGASCPAFTTTPLFSGVPIKRLTAIDATGDQRPELLVDAWYAAELHLLGVSTETRGDANGDSFVAGDDVDVIADRLLRSRLALSPSSDTNADRRVSIEDLFHLISYEYAGGAAPLP